MRLLEVKRSKPKVKERKGKIYIWRQYYLNVPKEYRDRHYLIVMAPEELIDILWDDKKREEAKKELDKLLK